jgi:DNA-directed RNA polymerase specialized sigma24 family protein
MTRKITPQQFFLSRILRPNDEGKGLLHTARRSKGKFRSFLCDVLWKFLKDQWNATRTARRGGGAVHIPLEDLALAEERSAGDGFKEFGSRLDRELGLHIIQRAADRSKHSKYLLAHFSGEMSQQEAANQLRLSVGAFKRAYHDFRKRLAHDLCDEVAKMVGPDEKEIRAEIAYLMSLFEQCPA